MYLRSALKKKKKIIMIFFIKSRIYLNTTYLFIYLFHIMLQYILFLSDDEIKL